MNARQLADKLQAEMPTLVPEAIAREVIARGEGMSEATQQAVTQDVVAYLYGKWEKARQERLFPADDGPLFAELEAPCPD